MEIIWSQPFKEDVKFYFKKKRYTKILNDIDKAVNELEVGNFIGDKLEGLNIPLNTAVYKVRLPNSSINVGKSGGFRLLYYVAIADKIYLAKIYSKKDDNRIPSDAQIAELINKLL